jgi:hypothetical protein
MTASQSGKHSSNRRGRPPGDPDTARSERVVTFLTRQQMHRLKDHAGARGLSISAVCAELLGGALLSLPGDTDVEDGGDR